MYRKLILLLAGLLVSAGLLSAQGRHHLHAYIGGAPADYTYIENNQMTATIDLFALYEPQYRVMVEAPVVTVDYAFEVFKWLRLGAELNYSAIQGYTSYLLGNKPTVEFDKTMLTALPSLRLMIPSPRHLRIYGKACAGVMVTMGKHQDAPVRFAYDLVPIGIEWGGQTVYGTAECCWGNVIRGARIGIGVRF